VRRTIILVGVLAALAAGPVRAGPAAEAEEAFAKDDFKRAIALYTQAIRAAGANPRARASALFDRAEGYGRIGSDSAAMADYAEALSLSQDNAFKAVILFSRGDLYSQSRHYDEAIADYTQALVLKPDMVGVLTARGQIYGRLKKTEAALADYEAELKINPKYPRALRGRAQILGLPDPTRVTEHPW
jgi:tetratricopeptide (TPR) repeat protein